MNQPKKSLTLYSLVVPLILAALAVVGVSTYVYTKTAGGEEPLNFNFSNKSETTENRNTNKAGQNLLQVSLTEAQLNSIIQQEAVGKSVKGYTLTSGSVDISSSAVTLTGTLNNTVDVEVVAVINSAGTDIVVSDVELTDAGGFESIKEALLKMAVNSSVDSYFNRYEGKLDHIELSDDKIDVFIYK